MLTIKSSEVVLEKDQYTSSSKSHTWPPGLCRTCYTSNKKIQVLSQNER